MLSWNVDSPGYQNIYHIEIIVVCWKAERVLLALILNCGLDYALQHWLNCSAKDQVTCYIVAGWLLISDSRAGAQGLRTRGSIRWLDGEGSEDGRMLQSWSSHQEYGWEDAGCQFILICLIVIGDWSLIEWVDCSCSYENAETWTWSGEFFEMLWNECFEITMVRYVAMYIRSCGWDF